MLDCIRVGFDMCYIFKSKILPFCKNAPVCINTCVLGFSLKNEVSVVLWLGSLAALLGFLLV